MLVSFLIIKVWGRIKKSRVRDLIKVHSLDFIVIQWTNLSKIPHTLFNSLWGNQFCE